MTNATANQNRTSVKGYIHTAAKQSDEAPMVITRLSGWIDMGETRTAPPAWIVRTRISNQSR